MKGLKRVLSLCLILAMVIGAASFSFADSAPSWKLDKEYDEGDYVKFRGTIYMVIEEHISSAATYPGNPEYWAKYKKGVGFKKDDEPTLDKLPQYKDKDWDKSDKDWDKDDLVLVYEEEDVKVYLDLKEFDDDEYEAKFYIYNDSEFPVLDWSLEFKLNEGEALEDVDDAEYAVDEMTVTITPESDDEEDKEIPSKKKVDFEIEVDTADLYDKKADVVTPYDYDLELTFGEAVEDDDNDVDSTEKGIVIVRLSDPSFDEGIFLPEITIADEEQTIEWGMEAVYEDLIVDKTYKVIAPSYKIDGMLYSPVLSTKTVKVSRDTIKFVTVSYKVTDLVEETGRVMVYVLTPSFDTELFTPEVTVEGESQFIDWGSYVYFDDITIGKLTDFSAETVVIDEVSYVPDFNTDEIEVKESKLSYLLLRYEVE